MPEVFVLIFRFLRDTMYGTSEIAHIFVLILDGENKFYSMGSHALLDSSKFLDINFVFRLTLAGLYSNFLSTWTLLLLSR